MESFHFISHSPKFTSHYSSLRKSSPNPNSRFLSIPTPELTPPPRTPSSPNHGRPKMLLKELDRIEEELDFKLMKLNKSQYEELHVKLKKERKIYERCIEGLNHLIQFIDVKVSRVINRAWIGYQKLLQRSEKDLKSQSKACYNNFTNTNLTHRDVAVQVFQETDSSPEEEYDSYINFLNRAIYRIGGMNHEKLIKKLKTLLNSLTPIEIPDEPESPESPSFASKINNLLSPIQFSLDGQEKLTIARNRLGYIQISRGEQTNSENSGPSYETLVSLNKAKDMELFQVREELARLKNIEKHSEDLQKELEATQRALKYQQEKECKNCKDRIEIAKRDRSKITEMQNSLNKSGKIREELDLTKNKLQESILVIGESNKKINVLTDNLEELQRLYENVKNQRMVLEARLSEEEKLRVLLENKLKLEQSKNQSLSKDFNKKLSFPIDSQEPIDDILQKFPAKNRSLARPAGLKTPEELAQTTLTPEPFLLSKTPSRENPRTHLLINESISSSKIRFKRLPKSQNLLSVLKMSKDDFLNLSKKARLELFECLFDHKERCGADCEHLKRAMQIRQKDKGMTLTLKKYNIVKH